MLSILKRYEVTIHKLNRLRFEVLREDRKCSGVVPAHFLKTLLKRLGLTVSSNDQRDLYTYFAAGISHSAADE